MDSDRYKGMKQIPILTDEDLKGTYNPKKLVEEYPAVVLRNCIGKHYIDINTNMFENDTLASRHGNMLVRPMLQNKEVRGFKVESKQYFQSQQVEMALKDYVDYQKNHLDHNWLKKQPYYPLINRKGWVLFGVNIDLTLEGETSQPGGWRPEVEQFYAKFLPFLMPKYKSDMLSYCRQDILGVTTLQMYLKIPGVWTGGHQENLGVRAVNINFGPGESEWITIDMKDVPKFREAVKNKYGFDIHDREGLWYAYQEDIDFSGVQANYIVQKPGDIVVLGPGTLHWVRSIGTKHSVQVAHNIMYKQFWDIKTMLYRFNHNQKINFKSIIKVKSLFLDFLFHEYHVTDKKIVEMMLQYLKKWVREDYSQFNQNKKILNKEPLPTNKNYEIMQCSDCDGELFNHYYQCESCLDINHLGQYLCTICLIKHKESKKCKKFQDIVAYFKYKNSSFQGQITKIELYLGYEQSEFCFKHQFIGNTIHTPGDEMFENYYTYPEDSQNQNQVSNCPGNNNNKNNNNIEFEFEQCEQLNFEHDESGKKKQRKPTHVNGKMYNISMTNNKRKTSSSTQQDHSQDQQNQSFELEFKPDKGRSKKEQKNQQKNAIQIKQEYTEKIGKYNTFDPIIIGDNLSSSQMNDIMEENGLEQVYTLQNENDNINMEKGGKKSQKRERKKKEKKQNQEQQNQILEADQEGQIKETPGKKNSNKKKKSIDSSIDHTQNGDESFLSFNGKTRQQQQILESIIDNKEAQNQQEQQKKKPEKEKKKASAQKNSKKKKNNNENEGQSTVIHIDLHNQNTQQDINENIIVNEDSEVKQIQCVSQEQQELKAEVVNIHEDTNIITIKKNQPNNITEKNEDSELDLKKDLKQKTNNKNNKSQSKRQKQVKKDLQQYKKRELRSESEEEQQFQSKIKSIKNSNSEIEPICIESNSNIPENQSKDTTERKPRQSRETSTENKKQTRQSTAQTAKMKANSGRNTKKQLQDIKEKKEIMEEEQQQQLDDEEKKSEKDSQEYDFQVDDDVVDTSFKIGKKKNKPNTENPNLKEKKQNLCTETSNPIQINRISSNNSLDYKNKQDMPHSSSSLVQKIGSSNILEQSNSKDKDLKNLKIEYSENQKNEGEKIEKQGSNSLQNLLVNIETSQIKEQLTCEDKKTNENQNQQEETQQQQTEQDEKVKEAVKEEKNNDEMDIEIKNTEEKEQQIEDPQVKQIQQEKEVEEQTNIEIEEEREKNIINNTKLEMEIENEQNEKVEIQNANQIGKQNETKELDKSGSNNINNLNEKIDIVEKVDVSAQVSIQQIQTKQPSNPSENSLNHPEKPVIDPIENSKEISLQSEQVDTEKSSSQKKQDSEKEEQSQIEIEVNIQQEQLEKTKNTLQGEQEQEKNSDINQKICSYKEIQAETNQDDKTEKIRKEEKDLNNESSKQEDKQNDPQNEDKNTEIQNKPVEDAIEADKIQNNKEDSTKSQNENLPHSGEISSQGLKTDDIEEENSEQTKGKTPTKQSRRSSESGINQQQIELNRNRNTSPQSQSISLQPSIRIQSLEKSQSHTDYHTHQKEHRNDRHKDSKHKQNNSSDSRENRHIKKSRSHEISSKTNSRDRGRSPEYSRDSRHNNSKNQSRNRSNSNHKNQHYQNQSQDNYYQNRGDYSKQSQRHNNLYRNNTNQKQYKQEKYRRDDDIQNNFDNNTKEIRKKFLW